MAGRVRHSDKFDGLARDLRSLLIPQARHFFLLDSISRTFEKTSRRVRKGSIRSKIRLERSSIHVPLRIDRDTKG